MGFIAFSKNIAPITSFRKSGTRVYGVKRIAHFSARQGFTRKVKSTSKSELG